MTGLSERIIKTLLVSQSLEEFCGNLHSIFGDAGMLRGVDVYTRVEMDSLLLKFTLADGANVEFSSISLDEDHSVAWSFRRKAIVRNPSSEPFLCAPIESQGILVGVISLKFAQVDYLSVVLDEHVSAIAAAVSAYLYPHRRLPSRLHLGISSRSKPQELTFRQLQILKRMTDGEIYSQIGRHMHISESLVKLEATRIFRFLKVSNKLEAIEAGKGLIDAPTEESTPSRVG